MSGNSALGVSVTGNGGLDTTYYGNVKCAMGAPGVFCGGKAGVDLNQALISVGYAQRFGALSLGIAPVMAVQVFSAYGLGAFGQFGLSSNPGELSDHAPAWSVGGGVRAGAQYHINEQLTVAVAGSTPIWSTPFDKYSGLFAGGGSFDVPGEIGAGIAYRVHAAVRLFRPDAQRAFEMNLFRRQVDEIPGRRGRLGKGWSAERGGERQRCDHGADQPASPGGVLPAEIGPS